jgi:O-antigen/teichoic acid export membrane protein
MLKNFKNSKIVEVLNQKTVRQTGFLYGSQLFSMVLGLNASVIVTRNLGPEKYGVLSFILAVFSFTSLFFEFGFFSTGARLLALTKDKERQRELLGILISVTTAIALSLFLTLFFWSYYIDSQFNTSAGIALRNVSILAGILPFQYMLEKICQGLNEIKKLAISTLIPKIWYLAGLLIVVNFSGLDVVEVLTLQLSGVVICVWMILSWLKPSFRRQWQNLILIWKENKAYGLHLYLGRVVDVSTYQLDKLFITYFDSTLSTGFYSLGMILTTPMALLSRSLSTSLFRGFAIQERIPKKVLIINFIWLIACVIGLSLLGRTLLVLLFSEKYLATGPLILPLALASFFQGLYQPYNMFLSARGKGKWLRNMALMMAGINLLSNVTLIPLWDAMGAAIASAISNAFSLGVYLFYYYRKYLKEFII